MSTGVFTNKNIYPISIFKDNFDTLSNMSAYKGKYAYTDTIGKYLLIIGDYVITISPTDDRFIIYRINGDFTIYRGIYLIEL